MPPRKPQPAGQAPANSAARVNPTPAAAGLPPAVNTPTNPTNSAAIEGQRTVVLSPNAQSSANTLAGSAAAAAALPDNMAAAAGVSLAQRAASGGPQSQADGVAKKKKVKARLELDGTVGKILTQAPAKAPAKTTGIDPDMTQATGAGTDENNRGATPKASAAIPKSSTAAKNNPTAAQPPTKAIGNTRKPHGDDSASSPQPDPPATAANSDDQTHKAKKPQTSKTTKNTRKPHGDDSASSPQPDAAATAANSDGQAHKAKKPQTAKIAAKADASSSAPPNHSDSAGTSISPWQNAQAAKNKPAPASAASAPTAPFSSSSSSSIDFPTLGMAVSKRSLPTAASTDFPTLSMAATSQFKSTIKSSASINSQTAAASAPALRAAARPLTFGLNLSAAATPTPSDRSPSPADAAGSAASGLDAIRNRYRGKPWQASPGNTLKEHLHRLAGILQDHGENVTLQLLSEAFQASTTSDTAATNLQSRLWNTWRDQLAKRDLVIANAIRPLPLSTFGWVRECLRREFKVEKYEDLHFGSLTAHSEVIKFFDCQGMLPQELEDISLSQAIAELESYRQSLRRERRRGQNNNASGHVDPADFVQHLADKYDCEPRAVGVTVNGEALGRIIVTFRAIDEEFLKEKNALAEVTKAQNQEKLAAEREKVKAEKKASQQATEILRRATSVTKAWTAFLASNVLDAPMSALDIDLQMRALDETLRTTFRDRGALNLEQVAAELLQVCARKTLPASFADSTTDISSSPLQRSTDVAELLAETEEIRRALVTLFWKSRAGHALLSWLCFKITCTEAPLRAVPLKTRQIELEQVARDILTTRMAGITRPEMSIDYLAAVESAFFRQIGGISALHEDCGLEAGFLTWAAGQPTLAEKLRQLPPASPRPVLSASQQHQADTLSKLLGVVKQQLKAGGDFDLSLPAIAKLESRVLQALQMTAFSQLGLDAKMTWLSFLTQYSSDLGLQSSRSTSSTVLPSAEEQVSRRRQYALQFLAHYQTSLDARADEPTNNAPPPSITAALEAALMAEFPCRHVLELGLGNLEELVKDYQRPSSTATAATDRYPVYSLAAFAQACHASSSIPSAAAVEDRRLLNAIRSLPWLGNISAGLPSGAYISRTQLEKLAKPENDWCLLEAGPNKLLKLPSRVNQDSIHQALSTTDGRLLAALIYVNALGHHNSEQLLTNLLRAWMDSDRHVQVQTNMLQSPSARTFWTTLLATKPELASEQSMSLRDFRCCWLLWQMLEIEPLQPALTAALNKMVFVPIFSNLPHLSEVLMGAAMQDTSRWIHHHAYHLAGCHGFANSPYSLGVGSTLMTAETPTISALNVAKEMSGLADTSLTAANPSSSESLSELSGVDSSATDSAATFAADSNLPLNILSMPQEDPSEANQLIAEIRQGLHVDSPAEDKSQLTESLQNAVEKLSMDIYSSEVHWMLELVQNCDDNHYAANCVPAAELCLNADATVFEVHNNEMGFAPKDVRAICAIGKSTKAGQAGYTGHKGIGFKAVFAVSQQPEIHSHPFHFAFDRTKNLGYLAPVPLLDTSQHPSACAKWRTVIRLPVNVEKVERLTVRQWLRDIRPEVLLFLRRVRHLTLRDEHPLNGFSHIIKLQRQGAFVTLESTENRLSQPGSATAALQPTRPEHHRSRWFVHEATINTFDHELRGQQPKQTNVSIAFPLEIREEDRYECLRVYAYLPLRSYGLPFCLNADFDVPASRDQVKNNDWNQNIRSNVPDIFWQAMQRYLQHADGDTGERDTVTAADEDKRHNASSLQTLLREKKVQCQDYTARVNSFLRFLPVQNAGEGFFSTTTQKIMELLSKEAWLPAARSMAVEGQETVDNKEAEGAALDLIAPCQAVVLQTMTDPRWLQVLTPDLVETYLGRRVVAAGIEWTDTMLRDLNVAQADETLLLELLEKMIEADEGSNRHVDTTDAPPGAEGAADKSPVLSDEWLAQALLLLSSSHQSSRRVLQNQAFLPVQNQRHRVAPQCSALYFAPAKASKKKKHEYELQELASDMGLKVTLIDEARLLTGLSLAKDQARLRQWLSDTFQIAVFSPQTLLGDLLLPKLEAAFASVDKLESWSVESVALATVYILLHLPPGDARLDALIRQGLVFAVEGASAGQDICWARSSYCDNTDLSRCWAPAEQLHLTPALVDEALRPSYSTILKQGQAELQWRALSSHYGKACKSLGVGANQLADFYQLLSQRCGCRILFLPRQLADLNRSVPNWSPKIAEDWMCVLLYAWQESLCSDDRKTWTELDWQTWRSAKILWTTRQRWASADNVFSPLPPASDYLGCNVDYLVIPASSLKKQQSRAGELELTQSMRLREPPQNFPAVLQLWQAAGADLRLNETQLRNGYQLFINTPGRDQDRHMFLRQNKVLFVPDSDDLKRAADTPVSGTLIHTNEGRQYCWSTTAPILTRLNGMVCLADRLPLSLWPLLEKLGLALEPNPATIRQWLVQLAVDSKKSQPWSAELEKEVVSLWHRMQLAEINSSFAVAAKLGGVGAAVWKPAKDVAVIASEADARLLQALLQPKKALVKPRPPGVPEPPVDDSPDGGAGSELEPVDATPLGYLLDLNVEPWQSIKTQCLALPRIFALFSSRTQVQLVPEQLFFQSNVEQALRLTIAIAEDFAASKSFEDYQRRAVRIGNIVRSIEISVSRTLEQVTSAGKLTHVEAVDYCLPAAGAEYHNSAPRIQVAQTMLKPANRMNFMAALGRFLMGDDYTQLDDFKNYLLLIFRAVLSSCAFGQNFEFHEKLQMEIEEVLATYGVSKYSGERLWQPVFLTQIRSILDDVNFEVAETPAAENTAVEQPTASAQGRRPRHPAFASWPPTRPSGALGGDLGPIRYTGGADEEDDGDAPEEPARGPHMNLNGPTDVQRRDDSRRSRTNRGVDGGGPVVLLHEEADVSGRAESLVPESQGNDTTAAQSKSAVTEGKRPGVAGKAEGKKPVAAAKSSENGEASAKSESGADKKRVEEKPAPVVVAGKASEVSGTKAGADHNRTPGASNGVLVVDRASVGGSSRPKFLPAPALQVVSFQDFVSAETQAVEQEFADSHDGDLGRYGEKLALIYAQQRFPAPYRVSAVNREGQASTPFDLVVYNEDNQIFRYIEVKSTGRPGSTTFPVSINEIRKLLETGEQYDLMLVVVTDLQQGQIVYVEHVSEKLDRHQLELQFYARALRQVTPAE